MNESFVPFNLAVKLKEKGFNRFCFTYFHKGEFKWIDGYLFYNTDDNDDIVAAPTISQVLKWLREEKKIYVDVLTFPSATSKEKVEYNVIVRYNSDCLSMEDVSSAQSFKTWEEAATEGIKYCLNNLIYNERSI